MPSRSLTEPIRRLWGLGAVSGLREGALLDRFLRFEDDTAFEAILSQHGPMVLSVCRRFLRDPHDVEDAFQATFLILVRKASGLRDREALGPWLYGVAYRVAVRARSRTKAYGEDQSEPADTRTETPGSAIERAEAAEALHEELARLAAIYRDPIVLCHLEGLTHDQAAERLDWPVGTVRGRLWRGREKLRERLARRGFGDEPQTLLDANRAKLGREAVPAPLVPAMVLSASRLAAGGSLRLIATPSVAALSKGVLGAMFWNSIKWPIALAVMLGVFGIGAATKAQQGRRAPTSDPSRGMPKPSSPPGPSHGHQASRNRDPSPFDGDPQPAQKPAEGPADDGRATDDPRNLPWNAFPEVNDEDAGEKIRAAQKGYDEQLARLSRESGEAKAEVEILRTELDELKKELGSLVETIRQSSNGASGEHADREITLKNLDRFRKLADETRQQLRYSSVKLEAAQLRAEDAESRLQSLKKRPRPVERLEVQPGDILRVEVLEALPGRPVTGEHVVRPDGMLSLGFYGKIYVAGLTTDEIKEKLILKMRKYLPDETLGLMTLDEDENTGKMKRTILQPRDSDRAYVDLVGPPK
ncbi:MAG: sigma-70 family RNA polymerase sigma factor [Isosphaeraceae bacterium]